MNAVDHGKAEPGAVDRGLLATGFALGIVGGLILGVSYVADLADAMLAVGWLLFVGGLVIAFVFGVRDARREGRSLVSSLGGGLRSLWSFFWAFMP